MGTGSSSTGSTADPAATAEGNSLQGKVEKFDRSKNTLTLSGTDKTIKLDSSTKVMKDGSSATLDDIKEGDQVRASYSGSGNTVKAQSVDITSAGMGGSPSGTGTGAGGMGESGTGSPPGGATGSPPGGAGAGETGTTK